MVFSPFMPDSRKSQYSFTYQTVTHEILASPRPNGYHIAMEVHKKAGQEFPMATTIKQFTGHALAELWNSAIIFAPHLAGCMCAGGFHVPLDPQAVEEDERERKTSSCRLGLSQNGDRTSLKVKRIIIR